MTDHRYTYGKAQPEDIYIIKKIEFECNLSPWSLRDYEREIGSEYFLVCKFEQKTVGFILARLITFQSCISQNQTNSSLKLENSINNVEESSESEFKNQTLSSAEAEILNIGVLNNQKRKNIGSILMKMFLDKIGGYDNYLIMLEVRASNIPAIKLYESFNFEIISKRKNLYSNPVEDGYVMKLKKNMT